MVRTVALTVDSIVEEKDGCWVGGRCAKDTIHVGDIFTRLYSVYLPKVQDGYGESVRQNEEPIQLCVERVRTYGQFFDDLDHGLTGELRVSGDGINKLVIGKVLGVEET